MPSCVIALIVFIERAQRRLLIQYPKRQVGNRMFQGDTSHLPLKLNTAGVIPPIFASSLLLLPATRRRLLATTRHCPAGRARSWPRSATASRSTWCSMRAMIVFFAFFYTAIVFNPKDTADQLKKHSGFIPGIRPGKRTAEYIDYVLTRITVDRRALPRRRLPAAGVPDFGDRRAVLPRRHLASDRGQRDARYGRADPGPPDCPPV